MGHDSMDGDIRKLLALLKKILKNHPQGSEQIAKSLGEQAFNLNLCFFSFIPIHSEDLAEFEEMYEELLSHSEGLLPKGETLKMDFKLSPEDVEFLKKHGMRF